MVTDTRADPADRPGRPEVCNVCQLHRFFGDDYEEIWDGERTARTGCVDMKRLLADRIVAPLRAGARALPRAQSDARRWSTRSSPPGPTASARWPPTTMAEVREKMGSALSDGSRAARWASS